MSYWKEWWILAVILSSLLSHSKTRALHCSGASGPLGGGEKGGSHCAIPTPPLHLLAVGPSADYNVVSRQLFP